MDPEAETEAEPIRRPRFRYRSVVVVAVNIAGVLWATMATGSGIVSAYLLFTGRQSGAWFGILVGGSCAWLGIFTLIGYFRESREIVVNDDGVGALAFGRTWRFIRWTEMNRIERIRCPMVTDWNTWRDGYEFAIRSRDNHEIRFTDRITSLTILLNLLNGYVEKHHIPLVAFDRSSNSRPKIRATVSDPAERKRLLREGYQTKLSSLTTT